MDRGAWSATVHGVARESDVAEHAHIHCMTEKKYTVGKRQLLQ